MPCYLLLIIVYYQHFSYSLSLIDALDTLIVLGNYSEFRRVVDIILTKSDFDKDINVSVFETNIRGKSSNSFKTSSF